MKKKVLIIDDDRSVCEEIKGSMQNDTTEVFCALSTHEGFEMLTKNHFCLIIMDAFLSAGEGVSLLKTIQHTETIPILILSAKRGSEHRISALRAGAHGYLEKPYELEECLAQAQSLMDLYTSLNVPKSRCYTLAFGMDLIIDPITRQATLRGEALNLTRKEFDLLFCLAEHAGQVLSREQLYNSIWDENVAYNIDELIKAHIKALRKKLTPAGKEYIKNVWGVGYRFSDGQTEEEQP